MEQITLRLGGTKICYLQEAYKTLRTNLQFCGEDIKTVAVTSCGENEGKTTVALNLAASLAQTGKKVLFIDGDMRKSVAVRRYTESRGLRGLSDVLSGQETLADCLYACQIPNLQLLFAGKYPSEPAELLSGKDFSMLLADSRKAYDYVIIDTPSLGRVIDAAVIAAKCDGAALVIGSKATTYREAQNVIAQLEKSGCVILGAIHNFIPAKKTKTYKRA